MKTLIQRILTAMVAVLLTALGASAYNFEENGIYYNLVPGGAEVTYGPQKYSGDVMIPATVIHSYVEYDVIRVGGKAFYECESLTSVTFEGSVKIISDQAFTGCKQLKIFPNLPSVTVIGGQAFEGCTSLTTVELPETLYDIGKSAFEGCSSLTTVTLPKIWTLRERTFADCTALKSCVITGNLDYIGSECFLNCHSLTSVIMPERVGSIMWYAFHSTAIREIKLPSSLRTIDSYAFQNTQLQNIEIPSSVSAIGWGVFSSTPITQIYIPSTVKQIGSNILSNCIFLTDATIDCKLDEGSNLSTDFVQDSYPMFYANKNLETVRIYGNISRIPTAFFYNVKIRDLYLGLNLQVISSAAFANSEVEDIYFQSPYPPKIYLGKWDNDIYEFEGGGTRFYMDGYVTAHIPLGTKEAFLNSELSSIFKNINYIEDLPVPDESSIDGAVVDNDTEITVADGRIIADGVVEVYATDGRLVGRGLCDDLPILTPGLYIVRTSSTAKKIIVR